MRSAKWIVSAYYFCSFITAAFFWFRSWSASWFLAAFTTWAGSVGRWYFVTIFIFSVIWRFIAVLRIISHSILFIQSTNRPDSMYLIYDLTTWIVFWSDPFLGTIPSCLLRHCVGCGTFFRQGRFFSFPFYITCLVLDAIVRTSSPYWTSFDFTTATGALTIMIHSVPVLGCLFIWMRVQ